MRRHVPDEIRDRDELQAVRARHGDLLRGRVESSDDGQVETRRVVVGGERGERQGEHREAVEGGGLVAAGGADDGGAQLAVEEADDGRVVLRDVALPPQIGVGGGVWREGKGMGRFGGFVVPVGEEEGEEVVDVLLSPADKVGAFLLEGAEEGGGGKRAGGGAGEGLGGCGDGVEHGCVFEP